MPPTATRRTARTGMRRTVPTGMRRTARTATPRIPPMPTVRTPTRTTPDDSVVDAPALTRLVGDAAGFLDEAWGRTPRHIAANDAVVGAAGLLTLDDVDRLVASSGLRAPAFRLVKQGRTLPQADVTRRVRIGSR